MSALPRGPWKVGNTYCTDSHPTRFWRAYIGNGEAIAASFGASEEEAEAIARLIAAAPDLLAALQDALEFAEDQEDTEDGPDGRPQANDAMLLAQTLRAAIAKATGEQP